MPKNHPTTADDRRISLIPVFIAKHGSADELQQALSRLQTISRRDPGCIAYNVFNDTSSRGRFFLYEQWEDEESLAEHNRQAHVTDFLATAAELLAEPLHVPRLRSIG
jgi:quinol monooxygenase YgiN